MEEVAPSTVSSVQQLAPEELQVRSGSSINSYLYSYQVTTVVPGDSFIFIKHLVYSYFIICRYTKYNSSSIIIIKKKGKKEVKGDSELTSTDRKRNRREKKAKQKAQKIHREAKLAKLKPTDRAVQEEAHKQLKKKSKNKSSGITMVDVSR